MTALLLALAISSIAQDPAPKPVIETIAEIRVHGNATLPDVEVIRLAGVNVGTTLETDGLQAIEHRLRDSGRFDEVQVRKRYRTLDMDQIALVLLVHEKPGLSPSGKPPSAIRRLGRRMMFLPIVDYEDGYGWTYGARTSTVGALGAHERLSVPLSWGADRHAALEGERSFRGGPLSRVFASYGISQRENPFFHVDDRRVELYGRMEKRLFGKLTFGADAARTNVTFGSVPSRIWTSGADVTLDTRIDPLFPTDAILTRLSWNRLHGDASPIDRYTVDARGYKRVIAATVLAGRIEYDTASAPLPPFEQWLLGGSSLRGMRAGTLVGDRRLLWSAELRIPVSSRLDVGRSGFTAFMDGGKAAAFETPLRAVKSQRSVGGGVFLVVPLFALNLEVAHGLDGRGTRIHFGLGFTF
jgi:outer membrane protein assembly factor BamA